MTDTPFHNAADTYSLTDFRQNAKEHLERMRETGRPEVLTVNGRAEAVVMTPAAYDRLRALAEADIRARVAEGLRQADAGRVVDGEASLVARRARRAGGKRRGKSA